MWLFRTQVMDIGERHLFGNSLQFVESKTCQFELRRSAFSVPLKLEKFNCQSWPKRVLALASGMAESDLET